MNYLLDNSSSPAAVIFQNTIIHPESLNVYGVILGNCVYGVKGQVIGKFFEHRLYDQSGEIIAISDEKPVSPSTLSADPSTFRQQAWQILDRIHSYIAPWIQPKNTWSSRSLQEALKQ